MEKKVNLDDTIIVFIDFYWNLQRTPNVPVTRTILDPLKKEKG